MVDAGVLVGVLESEAPGDEELVAPHLIDSEVAQVLRRLARQGDLTGDAATAATEDLVRLSLTRFPVGWLRGPIWALRHNLSAYDATYVALTEMLSATSLLTTDARLEALRVFGAQWMFRRRELRRRCRPERRIPGVPMGWRQFLGWAGGRTLWA